MCIRDRITSLRSPREVTWYTAPAYSIRKGLAILLLPINIKAEQHEKKITTRIFTAFCLNISYFLQPNYLRLPLSQIHSHINTLQHDLENGKCGICKTWHLMFFYLTGSQYQCDLFNTSSNPPAVVFSCCYYAGPVIIGDPLALFCISIPRV